MNILNIPILKRLLPSLVRRYLMLVGKNKINISINNFIFEIDIRESIERKTYFIREYEKKRMEYLILNSEKIKSNIFIDIGANIGFYSILLSNFFREIIAFEPNNRNFQVLTKNIKKNNLTDKIQTHNYGLGEKKQILKGNSMTKGELFQTSGFAVSEKNTEGEDVLIQKCDDILNFKEKTLTIKIDVEGYELSVIKGMKNILENNHCFLQIEIWDKNNDRIYDFLKELNYESICTLDGDTYFVKTPIKHWF